MKTPEEIKKGLECCAGAARCKECPYFSDNAAKCGVNKNRDALAYIQQLEAALPQWISVDERLPEDNVTVLVCQRNVRNGSCIMALSSRSTFSSAVGIVCLQEPWECFDLNYKSTHWMPLPQPPKKEENEIS